MISPYYKSRKGSVAPINLGVGVDPFNRTDGLCSKVWYEGVIGVGWTIEGSKIFEFIAQDGLFAYPTPDMSRMVVVYSDGEIKSPNNAVVLNFDGSKCCQLVAPRRLSSAKGGRLPRGGLSGFMQVGWYKDPEYMEVHFYIGESDFIESRLLRMSDFKIDAEFFYTWRL